MSIEQIGNNSDSNNQENTTNPWLAANLGVDAPDSYDDSLSTPLSTNLQSKRSEQHHSAEVDTMFRMHVVYWKLKEGLANFESSEKNRNEYLQFLQRKSSDAANNALFSSSSIGNLSLDSNDPEVDKAVIGIMGRLMHQFVPEASELSDYYGKALPESFNRIREKLSLARDSLGYVGQEEWDVYPSEDESSGEKRAFNPWNNNPGVDTPDDYDEMQHSMGEHTEQDIHEAQANIEKGIKEIKTIIEEAKDKKNAVDQLLKKAGAVIEELNDLKGSHPELVGPINRITREMDDRVIKELESILGNPAEQSMQEFIKSLGDVLNSAHIGISDVLSKPFTVHKEHNVF